MTATTANLGLLLSQTARLFPEAPGLVHGRNRWSWSLINSRVDAMARALATLGVRKGDRILVQARNSRQLFESCWVAFKLGCVWVPVNFRLAPREVAYIGYSSGAKVMIVDPEFEEHVEAVRSGTSCIEHVVWTAEKSNAQFSYEGLVESMLGQSFDAVDVSYDDPLWFFYTSGTTGKPKAGVLTHGQMAFVVTNHLADLIPGTTQTDRSIAVAPLSHGAGIHALLNVARGAATVLPESDRLDPDEIWRLVESERVTNFFAVPTIVKTLVESDAVDRYDHSSLRFVIYAGAPMYRADQRRALEKLGNVLVQYFGLGEVTGCITVLPREMHSSDDQDPNANVGSCGRPRTGMEVAILDKHGRHMPVGEVGEICCRGPAVFSGYHDNPDATAKALRDGWFHTGDLGRLDARGLLYITGRESDMYISGGSNVYPREVEEVFLTHPAVAEVAIFGVPDDQWGEVGIAVVSLNRGFESVNAADLLSHLDGRCARYRWPKRIHFQQTLPKSGYGKIAKKELREAYLTQMDLATGDQNR